MSQVKEGADIEKGGQKVFIVLHGEFRKNGSLTEDDPWGEEEGDSQSAAKLTAQVSGLSWEVFKEKESISLTGVQSVAEEDLTQLKGIEEYICSLPDVPIRFLVTDVRILALIKEIGLDWSTTFPFYDIIQTFNSIYSQSKTNLVEIFEFLSSHDAPQEEKVGQTELLQTSNRLSQIIGKILDQSSEFNLILNKEELINTANRNKADGWVDSTENPEKQLDDEEVWGEETAVKKDTDQQKELPTEQSQTARQNAPNTSETQVHASGEKRERSRSRSRSRSYEKKERSSQEKSTPSNAGKQQQSQSATYSEQQQPQYSQNTHFSSRQGRNEDTQEEPEASDSGFYLRLRGLPFNARERELFDFLGFTLEPDQVFFRYDQMGRFLGECVLRLVDQKQQERIASMHMRNMGKRYIEVFPANKSDFTRAQESQSFEGDRSAEDPASGSSYDSEFLKTVGIVKVRGLPYESSDQDIQSFFKESTIISNGIQKVYEGRRPSGEAFILFASKSDANKALEKDKQRMGTRYIEIFLCHPKEYTNYIKSRKQFSGGYQGNYNSGYNSGGYNQNHHQGGYGQGEYSRGGSSYGGRYDKYQDSNRYENNRYGGYNSRNDNGNSPNNQGFYRKPYQSRYGEEGGSRYGDDKYGSKPGYNSNSRPPYNNYNKYDPSKSRSYGGKRDDYNNSNYQSYDTSATQGYSNPNQSYSQQASYAQDTSSNGLSDASQQQSYPYYGSYQYASAGSSSGQAAATTGYYPSDQQYQQYPSAYQQQYSSQYYQQGVQSQPDGYSQNYGQPTQSAQAGVVPNSYYPQAGQTYDPSANFSGQHTGRQQY